MAGSDDDWAGNSVPWNPELPVFEPSHNLLLDAGPWTVPYSDFPPPPSPFALEMRSETIEQLVGGDALRRGESERIEAGRSEENSDAVAGRDRVRVQGTLHEHTGHGLAEQVAHLDTTVDGRLDVHTGNEDTVLLAGHMKDVWDGGTAIVAAMTDDLVAGGGVRVTAPLDLWVHGLMGVEERIGTCTADAVLLELGATHYEREYGPGVHAAGLAVYNGSLYLSNRSTFRPLMRVSSGVRNLIAGGGDGGAGGAPDASPPPAPAAAGAGTEAVSETFSAATGNARSVDAVVEAGARSDNLTGTRHISNATDAVRSEDLAAMNQAPAAQLDDLRDSLRPAGDETGGRAGTGSPYNAGSDWRVPQEGVERSDTQMEFLDEFLHNFNTMLDDRSRDTSLFAPAGDLSELNHSADSAEQLAALQRGDVDTASVQSIGSPIPGGTDDVHGSSDLSRAGTPVLERDRTPTPSWETLFYALTDDLFVHHWNKNQHDVDVHQAAVDAVIDKTFATFHQLGGNTDELHSIQSRMHRAVVARRILEQMADQARQAGLSGRVDEIVQALQEIDHHTYQTLGDAGLIDSAGTIGRHASSGTDDLHHASEIPHAPTSVPEIPRSESAGSLYSSQVTTPPDPFVRVTDSESDLRFGSLVTDEPHRRASLGYSGGGSVPATPVVGAAARLDANAASWLVLEDAFRLTDDLEFLPGSQRVGEPLSDVPHGLDESYPATDFGTFRRIDDAPADAPDEIRPRTGSSSEWEGGRSGTSSGQGAIGFGRPEGEGASPPGRQAGEAPGFGGADAKPQDRGYQFSFREWAVQNVVRSWRRGNLSLSIDNLLHRFWEVMHNGEVERGLRHALDALLQNFDAPRPNRGGRDRPI